MRGKISVVSELNKGTVFIIEIPVNSEMTSMVMDSQSYTPDSLGSNNFTLEGGDTPASSIFGGGSLKQGVISSNHNQ